MSHHFDAGLEAELDRRRATFRHEAEEHRMARVAGRARVAATRLSRPARSAPTPAGREVAGPVHA